MNAQDIICRGESKEEQTLRREMAALQTDISTAKRLISDALAKYRKKMEKNRAKAASGLGEDPYQALADYESKEAIHDAFGYGYITEAEMRRLLTLWDAREEKQHRDTIPYEDRVTKMLEHAMWSISDRFGEPLEAWMARQRELEGQVRNSARTRAMGKSKHIDL